MLGATIVVRNRKQLSVFKKLLHVALALFLRLPRLRELVELMNHLNESNTGILERLLVASHLRENRAEVQIGKPSWVSLDLDRFHHAVFRRFEVAELSIAARLIVVKIHLQLDLVQLAMAE